MSINILTPLEAKEKITHKMREIRLSQELTQEGLAKRAGVSLGTLKKFERTGDISLETFLKLAFILGFLDKLNDMLSSLSYQEEISLEKLLQHAKKRQRGRIK